jgi:hypothetical protein
MNDLRDEVRDVLRRKAQAQDPVLGVPEALPGRVRRRIARNAIATGAVLAVLAAGVVVGLVSLGSAPANIPAHSGTDLACAAGDLRATLTMEGAMGSREGAIVVTNASDESCTLQGRPTLAVLDERSQPVTEGITFAPVEATWTVEGAPEPDGWPVVRLAAGAAASVRVRWTNWCADPAVPGWRLTLPDGGDVEVTGLEAVAVPPCNGPTEGSTVEVGPFEPTAG